MKLTTAISIASLLVALVSLVVAATAVLIAVSAEDDQPQAAATPRLVDREAGPTPPTGRSIPSMPPTPPPVPRVPGPVALSGLMRALDVQGSYAYVSTSEGGLYVLDVSDPARPMPVGRGDTRPGTFGSDAFGMQVEGNYLYLATTYGGLQIMDVANPAAPLLVSQLETGVRAAGVKAAFANDVKVHAGYAYVADAEMRVVDVSDPRNPKIAGSLMVFGYGGRLALHNGHVFLTKDTVGYDGVQIIDVRDPAAPRLVGSLPGGEQGLAFEGSIAYLLNPDQLVVADVSSPAAHRVLATMPLTPMAHSIQVSGGIAYISVAAQFPYGPSMFSGLLIVDVRAPEAPVLVSSIEVRQPPRTAGANLVVRGDLAYLLTESSLEIIELSQHR